MISQCEFLNPGMSHKDRIAKAMLMAAEKRGDLTAPDGTKKTILAASSGNTGCSLALIGTLMGYEVVVITNAKCSMEKRVHIQSNGATLWMAEELPDQFPTEIGTEGDYIKQEDLLAAAFPDRFYSVNQYANPDNAAAHFGSTGREIWEQTKGRVTHFVMSGSTGGTIMGVGQYLKEKSQAGQSATTATTTTTTTTAVAAAVGKVAAELWKGWGFGPWEKRLGCGCGGSCSLPTQAAGPWC